jgi:DNA-binding NtrC family response regulator
VPPLRERLDDLQILVEHFLAERDAGDKASLFTPEVLGQMRCHDWPGNVRELRNYVERALVLEDDVEALGSAPRGALAGEARPGPGPAAAGGADLPFKEAKDRVIADFERAYLTELLRWAGGNVSKAARKAQLDRMHLHRLFQRHGLRSAGPLEE